MKINNYIVLEFSSRSANEAFARQAVAAFAAQLDPTLEELSDLKTAVSEAVTNAIIHGYGCNKECFVVLRVIVNNRNITIIVQDYGKGIEDIESVKKPFFTPLAF